MTCERHTVKLVRWKTLELIAEIPDILEVWWERKRDDISNATVRVGSVDCCEVLKEIGVVRTEIHIYRGGVRVWRGKVTRIEFGVETTEIVAEDMFWVAKHSILETGYNFTYPNIASAGYVMHWLLTNQCYSRYGDPHMMADKVIWHQSAGEAKTSRQQHAYATTVWDDVDSFAEDGGMDYTMVNDTIHIFDNHYAWSVLPPLGREDVVGDMVIVEYSSEFATRAFVTNGAGYAGSAIMPPEAIAAYGVVDEIIATWNDAVADGPPSAEDLAQMADTAKRNLGSMYPPDIRLRISEGSRLTPSAQWNINSLIPGSWFQASAQVGCRFIEEWHRLNSFRVDEDQDGEVVTFISSTAPATRVDP
jgi:hypothetical protein